MQRGTHDLMCVQVHGLPDSPVRAIPELLHYLVPAGTSKGGDSMALLSLQEFIAHLKGSVS